MPGRSGGGAATPWGDGCGQNPVSIFSQKTDAYAQKIKGQSIVERATSLAKLRDADGHCAQVDYDPQHGLRLTEYHSPLAELIRDFPSVARMEEAMLPRLLQVPVQREASSVSGLMRITFLIAGATQPPPAPPATGVRSRPTAHRRKKSAARAIPEPQDLPAAESPAAEKPALQAPDERATAPITAPAESFVAEPAGPSSGDAMAQQERPSAPANETESTADDQPAATLAVDEPESPDDFSSAGVMILRVPDRPSERTGILKRLAENRGQPMVPLTSFRTLHPAPSRRRPPQGGVVPPHSILFAARGARHRLFLPGWDPMAPHHHRRRQPEGPWVTYPHGPHPPTADRFNKSPQEPASEDDRR